MLSLSSLTIIGLLISNFFLFFLRPLSRLHDDKALFMVALPDWMVLLGCDGWSGFEEEGEGLDLGESFLGSV